MAKLLYFGPLSDMLEVDSMTVPLPGKVKTIHALVKALQQRGPRWQPYLDLDRLQITRNRQFCDANTEIANNERLSLFHVRAVFNS